MSEGDVVKVSEKFQVPPGLEELVRTIRETEIDLEQSDMKKGRRIRDAVFAAVKAMAAGTPDFPGLLADEEFVGGSFGRRTQAQPLDDLDLFLPLDAAALRMESPSNSPTREGLVSRTEENALGCRASLHEAEWLHSGKLLDHIEQLSSSIPLGVHAPEKNPRGRCLGMNYDGINVDLVFVLMSEVPGRIDRYHLPSGDSWCWKATNPREDQRQLSEANQAHGGLLLPTIRALKAWNANWLKGRLKSVHLEVLASHYLFQDVEIDSVVSALTHAFHELPRLLEGECPDPTNLGEPLDINLHPDDRDWVKSETERAKAFALKANRLAATDAEAGATIWREILLTTEAEEAPERTRPPRTPRHDDTFGQPAHHCDDTVSYKQFNIARPGREDQPVRAPDQSDRSGEYA